MTDAKGVETCMNHFSSAVSWTYDYSHRIQKAEQLTWMNDNNLEFVPMVFGFRVDYGQSTPGSAYTSCFLTQTKADNQGGALCNGATELIAQIQWLKSQFTHPIQYLSTINEPFRPRRSNVARTAATSPLFCTAQVGIEQPRPAGLRGLCSGVCHHCRRRRRREPPGHLADGAQRHGRGPGGVVACAVPGRVQRGHNLQLRRGRDRAVRLGMRRI